MATLAKLLVALGIDAAGVEQGVDKANASLGNLGKGMAKVGAGLSAALTLPLLAAGKTVLDVGNQFDSAMDTIRTGAGATGDDLTALGNDMRAVFRQIPTDMDTAAQAIADLNTRTGQTGEGLQELAKTTILLSRLTGQELAPLIASTTRAFGDWGVETDKQTSTLDLFWKVSQSTGIGVDQLANTLVQFGAPLRQMGFDLETSAALLGKWEKEGVNAELVLGSLRIALVKMAKEGITDTKAALIEITQRIREAGSAGEANALAMEFFGARAGPDMAAAIREGRFEIAEFLAELQASPETIQRAAADTFDFAENFAVLKNRVIDALIPLGQQFFAAANSLIPVLTTVIEKIVGLITGFTNLPAGVQQGIFIFLGLVAAIGPVLVAIGGMIGAVSTIAAAFGTGGALAGAIPFIVGLLGTILPVVLPIVAIAAVLYLAWKENFLGIQETTAGVLSWLTGAIPTAMQTVQSVIAGGFSLIKAIVTGDWETVRAISQSALASVQNIVSTVWSSIVDFIRNALVSIVASVTGDTEKARAIVDSAFNTIRSITETVFGAISTLIQLNLALWGTVIETGLAFIKGAWEGAWNAVKTIAMTVWTNIQLVIDTALTLIKGLIVTALQILSGDWQGAWNTITSTLTTVWENMVAIATNSVAGLVSAVLSALGGLAEGAYAAGSALATRFGEGIANALNWALDRARQLADAIRNLLPGSDAKEGPLSDLFASGRALPITIAEGIARTTPLAEGLARDMALGISRELAPLKDGTAGGSLDGGLSLPTGAAGDNCRCTGKVVDAIGQLDDALRSKDDVRRQGGGIGAGTGRALGVSFAEGLARSFGLPLTDMGMRKEGGGSNIGGALDLPGGAMPGLGIGADPGESKDGGSVTLTINNPQPRAAEADITRALRNLQYMGVLNPLSSQRR